MNRIHATAIVEDGARIGSGVEIGPFCLVGAGARLDDGVKLDSHVVVEGRTRIGARTRVWPFAVLGGAPQDLVYSDEDTEVVIGQDCLLREYVTIHRGTAAGRGRTVVGDGCFLMLGAHVAHDCIVGEKVILSVHVALGGHCQLGDHVIMGGLSGVQQRTRIGAHAFIGGVTAVTSNVVPYAMAAARGSRPEVTGLNIVGLRRRGFDRPVISALRAAYLTFFEGQGTRRERIAAVRAAHPELAEVGDLADFIEGCGDAPLVLPRKALSGGGPVDPTQP
ncbi:MAG: acyl-ACP--UDP-N-acetylglucosamine O-acyltransferase [Alphaproteobacteria bacterium]